MERLTISKNKRYFENQDGTPFVWIADTNWTMPQRMKWDDVIYFMEKRKAQGFTMLQIVALDPESDVEMKSPSGHKALIDDDLSKPNEKYFEYLDWILDKAEEYGFYVLLLPVWGQLVVGDNWANQTFDKTCHAGNSYEYGKFIGNRYKDRKNILWCLGGDRHPIHKEIEYFDVWRNMAEGLAKGLTEKDLKHNESKEEWEKLLITYHACHAAENHECSTMSYWTDADKWISYIMLQSGHSGAPKNYEIVKKEYDREITMPVWDGEPAYEDAPNFPNIGQYHGPWMVRKRAYWSLLAGSFGHTYGQWSIWATRSERETNPIFKYSWLESVEHPGANQIKYLRDFMESKEFMKAVPSQEILLNQKEKAEDILDLHNQASMNIQDKEVFVYLPSGGKELVDLSKLVDSKLSVWWFNTKDGKFYDEKNNETETPEIVEVTKENYKIEINSPTSGEDNDWLCIIEEFSKNTKPVENKIYFEENKVNMNDVVFDF